METLSAYIKENTFRVPAFVPPQLTAERLAYINKAASAHASRNLSDPFAFDRIRLHMLRGIADPSQVLADARPE